MSGYAAVVPLAPLGKAGTPYTYEVPPRLAGVSRGLLVSIPFVNRKITGVVFQISPETNRHGLKQIIDILDPCPAILPYQLDLAQWMADEYSVSLAAAVSAMLPPGYAATGDAKPARPRVNRLLTILPAGVAALDVDDTWKRAPKQKAVLEALRESGGAMLQDDMARVIPGAASVVPKLVSHGWARRDDVTAPAGERDIITSSPNLSAAQAQAVASVIDALRPAASDPGPGVFLVHGVTGSGKTEVYMNVIAEVIRSGRQAIAMVPEISLTPQAVARFRVDSPDVWLRCIAVYHLRTGGWSGIAFAGARRTSVLDHGSALFAPMERLGVVVLDEEHDSSYKQGETPRYHARDVAVRLGAMLNIPIILGSATPDVTS